MTIRGFDHRTMKIAHAAGLARIPFVDFPDDWRNRIAWGADELPSSH